MLACVRYAKIGIAWRPIALDIVRYFLIKT